MDVIPVVDPELEALRRAVETATALLAGCTTPGCAAVVYPIALTLRNRWSEKIVVKSVDAQAALERVKARREAERRMADAVEHSRALAEVANVRWMAIAVASTVFFIFAMLLALSQ